MRNSPDDLGRITRYALILFAAIVVLAAIGVLSAVSPTGALWGFS